MKQTRFVLSGETPSKKNSRINTRSGRSFPSKRFTQWHDEKALFISSEIASGAVKCFQGGGIALYCTFVHGDKKRRDSDNQLASILDLLVDCGVIPDDCWQVVNEKHILDEYEQGAENSRVIITIMQR